MNNNMEPATNAVNKRYDFVLFVEVENGNPNGDPDVGNMPRIDIETNKGLITDVCIKRKIRNYVSMVKEGESGYDIYVTEGEVLNDQHKKAYTALGLTSEPKKLPKNKKSAADITQFLCNNFFDIRAFGAVMSTDVNGGTVTGPIQVLMGNSVDRISPQQLSITRMAVTNEADIEKERTMGNKWIVPYGLYRIEGHISANLAKKSGFGQEDLELFWQALEYMFMEDISASRGKMDSRKLIVFEHKSAFGNAKPHVLFEAVKATRIDQSAPARCFGDYEITIDRAAIPDAVTVIERF